MGVSKTVIGLLRAIRKLYVLLLSQFYLICFEALFFFIKEVSHLKRETVLKLQLIVDIKCNFELFRFRIFSVLSKCQFHFSPISSAKTRWNGPSSWIPWRGPWWGSQLEGSSNLSGLCSQSKITMDGSVIFCESLGGVDTMSMYVQYVKGIQPNVPASTKFIDIYGHSYRYCTGHGTCVPIWTYERTSLLWMYTETV